MTPEEARDILIHAFAFTPDLDDEMRETLAKLINPPPPRRKWWERFRRTART